MLTMLNGLCGFKSRKWQLLEKLNIVRITAYTLLCGVNFIAITSVFMNRGWFIGGARSCNYDSLCGDFFFDSGLPDMRSTFSS